ncbi:CvpA family protein [Deminuibacter soli]|uniref:CvpA family protein n=1 Tax=Deminuibacter soli TaxID=2291815 RepID=A0A3E1NRU0_9BACT|nr:CvpA family protein [Deminuibacter soli]RFM30478.1 CvpA family protein [Deminuibacter soli]
MAIDLVCLILIVLALVKGFTKGLVLAVFSFLAVVIGLAAALKLSVVVAGWLQGNTHIATKWLPFISFIIVLLGVILLVRWCAALIQAGMDVAMLGWINKLGGICFYLALYLMVFSILLFFAKQTGVLKNETISQSICYNWIEPWGPVVMNGFGKVVPVCRDMFTQLEKFFGTMAEKA